MTLTLSNWEKRWGWLFLALQMFLVPNGCALLCLALDIRSNALANSLAFFLNAALALVFFRDLLAQSVRNNRWSRTLVTVLKGFGLYWLLSLAVTMVIFAIRPDFANINDAGINTMIDEYPALMAIAVIVAAPLAEECLFRGWIFTSLAQRSVPLASAATAIFFAGAHITGYLGLYDPVTLLLCFLQYLGPSVVLCRTYRQADSLIAPVLLHMTINTIAFFVTR